MEVLIVNLYVAPALVLIAWLLWIWRDRSRLPRWRRYVLLSGILAVTLNVLTFQVETAYLKAHATALDMERVNGSFRHFHSASDWGLWLLAAGVAGAICGKGHARPVV